MAASDGECGEESERMRLIVERRRDLEERFVEIHRQMATSFTSLAEAVQSRRRQLLRQIEAIYRQQLSLIHQEADIGNPQNFPRYFLDLAGLEEIRTGVLVLGRVELTGRDPTRITDLEPLRVDEYLDGACECYDKAIGGRRLPGSGDTLIGPGGDRRDLIDRGGKKWRSEHLQASGQDFEDFGESAEELRVEESGTGSKESFGDGGKEKGAGERLDHEFPIRSTSNIHEQSKYNSEDSNVSIEQRIIDSPLSFKISENEGLTSFKSESGPGKSDRDRGKKDTETKFVSERGEIGESRECEGVKKLDDIASINIIKFQHQRDPKEKCESRLQSNDESHPRLSPNEDCESKSECNSESSQKTEISRHPEQVKQWLEQILLQTEVEPSINEVDRINLKKLSVIN